MSVLAGRSALVTGASRGIGLEVSRALAADGMRVAMLARSADALQMRAAEIGGEAFPCDVTSESDVARTTDQILSAFGGAPNVLVNNAGIFELSPIEETTPAAFRRALDANLVAPFLLIRALLTGMREAGTGHIVTIGSVADHTTFPENGAYAASKFGVRALHEVLRAELRGTGIRATLVSPSAVDTPLWDAIEPRPGLTNRRNMLRAESVAAAVRFAVMQPDDVNVDELRLSRA